MHDGLFCGRVGLLRTLDSLLARARGEGIHRIVLHGPAGVGKSALVARLREARPPGSMLVLPLAALRGGWAREALAARRSGLPAPLVVAFDEAADPEGDDPEDGLAAPLAELTRVEPGVTWLVVLRAEGPARALAAVPGAMRYLLEPLGRADAAILAAELLEPSKLPLDAALIARVVRLVGGRPAWLKALALRLAAPGAARGEDPVLEALVAELAGPGGRIGTACRTRLEEAGLTASEASTLARLGLRGGQDVEALGSALSLGPARTRESVDRLAARGLVVEGPAGPVLADPLFGLWLRIEYLGGGEGPAVFEAARAYDRSRRADPGPAVDLGSRVLGLITRAMGKELPGELVGADREVRPVALELDAIPVVFDRAGAVDGVPAVLAAEARLETSQGSRLLCLPRLGRPVTPRDLAGLARFAELVAHRSRTAPPGLWVVADEGFTPEARSARDQAWLTDSAALATWIRDEALLAA